MVVVTISKAFKGSFSTDTEESLALRKDLQLVQRMALLIQFAEVDVRIKITSFICDGV